MEILRNWILSLDADQILRTLGADPAKIRSRRPGLVKVAEWALAEGLPLLETAVIYNRLQVKSVQPERIELVDGASKPYLAGALIPDYFRSAEEIIPVICTVGAKLEELGKKIIETNPLEAMALEALGSAAAEALAVQACYLFTEEAFNKGWQSTLPLSPGMLDWPVEQGQPQLFSLLQAEEVGVKLDDNHIMHPHKTVSFVLGSGRQVSSRGKMCVYCSLNETCKNQNHYD